MPVLFLVLAWWCGGCSRADELTAEDYKRADTFLEQASRTGYEPVRQADGSPFRIAYVDIDPYPPSGEMLYYFVERLMTEGWIDTGEDIPFSPLDTDAKELIHYLSQKDTAGYLEFADEITYYLAIDGEDACRESLNREAEEGRVDLIFCMGTWPGTFVKEMGITDIPIMVYFSVNPEGAGIIDSTEDSGQDNLWSHVNYTVYNNQLAFYHENFAFRNLGSVYYDESVGAMGAYRNVARERGFTITEKKIDKLTETDSNAEGAYYRKLAEVFEELIREEHVDAFLLGTDIIKDERRIETMLEPFYEAQIPVFVQNGEFFVQKGALMMVTASNAQDQAPFVVYTLGAILHGMTPREMPQEYLSPPYLALNLDAADKLGYQVPNELILSAGRIYQSEQEGGR